MGYTSWWFDLCLISACGERISRGHHFTDAYHGHGKQGYFFGFSLSSLPLPAQDLSDDFDDRKKEERGEIQKVLLHSGVFTIRELFPL